MIRHGKIARLPAHIREQLGERMERGEGGAGLLAWLNSLPQVKQVLAEEFGGVPISKQNLSEWRQGGYRDWRAHRDTMEQVRQLVSDSRDLEEFMDEKPLADHLATLVAVRYAAVLSNTDGEAQDRHQLRALRGLLRDIIDLRRSDHQAQRLAMERERWAFERRKLEEQAEKQERYKAEDRVLAPFDAAERAAQLTEAYGGSEAAKRVAARAAEVGYDLPPGYLSEALSRPPSQSESSQVKPNPTESKQEAVPFAQEPQAVSDRPLAPTNGFPSPPPVSSPIQDERFALCGPPNGGEGDEAHGHSCRDGASQGPVNTTQARVKPSEAESNQSKTLVKVCQDQSNSLTISGLSPFSEEPCQTESNQKS